MVSVIKEQRSDCIAMHEYDDSRELDKKYGHSYRVHLTKEELEVLETKGFLEGHIMEWESERITGRVRIHGRDGELPERLVSDVNPDMVNIHVSSKVCYDVRQRGFSEESHDGHDFYFLLTRCEEI